VSIVTPESWRGYSLKRRFAELKRIVEGAESLVKERFQNDDEANAMLSRPQRAPYGFES
jgi:hypothetical protein